MITDFSVIIHNDENGTITLDAALTPRDGVGSGTVRSRTFGQFDDSDEIDAWIRDEIADIFSFLNNVS